MASDYSLCIFKLPPPFFVTFCNFSTISWWPDLLRKDSLDSYDELTGEIPKIGRCLKTFTLVVGVREGILEANDLISVPINIPVI
jgi:hypothetical protein